MGKLPPPRWRSSVEKMDGPCIGLLHLRNARKQSGERNLAKAERCSLHVVTYGPMEDGIENPDLCQPGKAVGIFARGLRLNKEFLLRRD
jgi:hypothetical protein